jgi:hypothetical protein
MDYGREDSWHDRYGSDPDGICNFKQNYDFYFKWLLDKVMQIFVIKDESESEYDTKTINFDYLKSNLLLDGDICITDFDKKLYAVTGNLGGEPDEYYIPVVYTVANPILGSKMVYRKDWKTNVKNGVLIFNSDIDSLGWSAGPSRGLFDLIHQTATLLADNIVSINCQQINSRVHVFFTVEDGDGENKAEAGSETLRKMYSGRPYQVLKEDLFGSIKVNPVATSATANSITQLVELQNFIVAHFFQTMGVKANDIMKKERLITAEIEEQNDIVSISLLELVTAWERGFEEVNKFYGTDIHVSLNPVLLKEIAQQFALEETPAIAEEEPEEVDQDAPESISEPDEEPMTGDTEEASESDTDESEQPESISEEIEQLEEVVDEVIDVIIDNDDQEGGDKDDDTESES